MKLLINLLPPQERCCPDRLRRGIIIAAMIWLATLLSCSAYVSLRTAWLEGRMAQARQSSEVLKCDELAMESANEKKEAIRERNAILTEIGSSRTSWLALMMHLGEVVPKAVSLTEVGLADDKVVIIKGRAENTSEVFRFLQLLEQDAFFFKARLVSLGAQEKAGAASKAFEITLCCKE